MLEMAESYSTSMHKKYFKRILDEMAQMPILQKPSQ